MPSDTFGHLLNAHLGQRKLSQAAFAKRVGVVQGFVGLVATGKVAMPEAKIAPWADALGLAGLEREEFEIAALLTRCPDRIVAYVNELEAVASRPLVKTRGSRKGKDSVPAQ